MIRSVTLSLLLGALVLAFAGCGEDCKGLCGSECDLRSCKYNRIRCHGFWEGDGAERHIKDLKVFYQYGRESSGYIYTGILIFTDLLDIDPVTGHCWETEADLLAHVELQAGADGEPWPAIEGNRCCITKGGEEAGATFAGKCGFLFDNGRTLTAPWSCTLEDPLAE